MEAVEPLRVIFAFAFVLGLIALMAAGLRYYSKSRNLYSGAQPGGRLHVVETRYLDPKRRLVLVRRDDKEHLLLLADGRETVIESGVEVKNA